MKIEKVEPIAQKFIHVGKGQCFRALPEGRSIENPNCYLKLELLNDIVCNAVNLETGDLAHFDSDAWVIVYDAKVVGKG